MNVKASAGYTYDHKGEPIYSTTGLTVNQVPYRAEDLGIKNSDFTSPEDLFIFTDSEGEKTIYIIDSESNKLFVFDENLTLQETVSKFKVKRGDFDQKVLKEIKSGKEYVIAREEKAISIPFTMEQVYLVYNDSLKDDKIPLDYELSLNIPQDSIVKWTSSNTGVAIYKAVETEITIDGVKEKKVVEYISATGVGTATLTGEVYTEEKVIVVVDEKEEEKIIKTSLGSVTIKIEVTEEKQAVEPADKHNNFTIKEIESLDSFNLHLSGATCVYRAVNRKGEDLIYITDKGNNQIIILNTDYEVVQFVTTPNDVIFNEKKFSPNKIITDVPGRMYVIADNVYEGIMQFSKDGVFNSFTGVNYVVLSAWEIFWRNFSTEEQLAKQATIVNTSFTSLSVDARGFIYTTSYGTVNEEGLVTDDKSMVKKINTAGKDVLRRNGYQPPKGDVVYIVAGTQQKLRGPSKFTGITVNEFGMYTVLDSKMGKLFTYDNEGKLLYVSGESMYIGQDKGTQINTLSNPVAIRYFGENILVLDKNNKTILTYEPTDIGRLINEAAKHEYVGDSENAANTWEKVVELNANYEYGYIGIGKKYMEKKDYKTAMEYFQKGAERNLYSKAYKLYRDGKIRIYFGPIMILVFGLIGTRIVYKVVNRKKFNKDVNREDGDD
jgi:hypothetical protein